MLTEGEVRSRVREALEVVTPPAPWLAGRIQKALEVETPVGRGRRGLRISLRAVAGVTLIVLAVASLATFLLSRSSATRAVPAAPSSPSYPSSSSYSRGFAFGGPAMVTRTEGWDCCVPFMHTTDGGAHWIDVTPKGVGRNFEDYYVDATHAWVNDWSGAGPLQLTTFRTADGGRTWERGTPLTIGADASGRADDRFYFLDPNHGWLLVSTRQSANGSTVYADTIYRTQDGGLHWTIAAVHAAPLGWTSPKFYCFEWCGQITFISASTGWLSTYRDTAPVGPALLITRDGGITWNQQTLPRSKVPCPCFADRFLVLDDLHATFLLLGPYNGTLSSALGMTSDGGNSWVVRSLPGEAQMIVGFYDMQHGWAVAGSRASMIFQPPASVTSPTLPLPLYWTDDGGLTWKRVQTDLQLQGAAGRVATVYFVDREVGFAIRQPTTNGQRQLLRTADGGHTWTLIASNL